MTTLQYEDSGYRQNQHQKEKEEYAIKFAEWLNKEFKFKLSQNVFRNLIEVYKIYEVNGQV